TCLGAFTRRKNQRTTSHKQADRTEAFHSRCSVNRWIQIAVCNSRNAVSFSSARTTNRFPSPRCASAIESFVSGKSCTTRPLAYIAIKEFAGCWLWLWSLADFLGRDNREVCNFLQRFAFRVHDERNR